MHQTEKRATRASSWLIMAAAIVGALGACSDDGVTPPSEGSIQVTVATTGTDLDPDGYSVLLDGGGSQSVGVSGSVTFSNVPAGSHQIELDGIAANCSVTGANPSTVSVVGGETATVNLAVVCTQIVVDLKVVTITTGQDIDADGYTFAVDTGTPQAIAVNDSVTVSAVPGNRSVALAGVASNCTPDGTNPRSVTVPSSGSARVEFAVSCTAITGSLTVIASTTGGDLDADGYMVSVDGGPAQALATNGQVVFNNATAGDRSVELTGIAPNCSVIGSNPATVTVPAQGNVDHTFTVECTELVGSVEVTTVTTGSSLDADGYSVTVGAQAPVAIGVNATETVGSVPVGMPSVELTGVASNCTVTDPNPRTVTVTDGGTAMTTFQVECFTPLSSKIVFDTGRNTDSEIYVMNPDGTDVVRLTDNPADDRSPYISHDGAKIVFVSDRDGNDEIYIMNADGTGQTRLTNDGAADTEPAWSPDGTKIVFTSERDGNPEVYVMDPNGSNQTRLTNQAGRDGLAQYSPDGTELVFTSERDGDLEIWVMDANGSNPTQLTSNTVADFAAAYSPDGTEIAFTTERDGNREVYVMDANGSNPVNLTNDASADLAPQWSPDGTQLAFASDRDGNNEVYTMNADGSSQTNRTNHPSSDFEVSWR